jgi:uncharacterized protein (TIGR02996 family)
MPDDAHFLRALVATPQDNHLRLVYADWLEDHDDPRAAFLRAEVTLHQSEPNSRSGAMRERLHQARRGLDFRWLALVDRPQAGWRIIRNGPPRVHGKAIPVFIHNFSYHLSTVDVYPDGAIYCWGYVDLPLFRGKLAEGWVVPRAEVGDAVSIHNLGQARVRAAEWERTPDDIEREVIAAIQEFNPAMQGLLDMQGTDVEVHDGVRQCKGSDLGQGKLYRISVDGDEVLGDELPVLEAVGDGFRLRRWLIYADGLSQLDYANELVPLEAVARMFEEGRLTLSVPAGAWVTLDGLGRFQAGDGWWVIKPAERVREAADLVDLLNGGKGSRVTCFEAHEAYQADPSEERREALRAAYEAVPEHLRMFCGDQDTKDWPIRQILYGSESP